MREQPSALPDHASRQAASDAVDRSLRARMAAHAMHAANDARVTTANGRAAFQARFEAEVDPDGILEPDERRRRAEQARRAYFTRLSLAAARARRAKRATKGTLPRGGEAA
jgi:hypothetical protein